jgi:hypothetical protein
MALFYWLPIIVHVFPLPAKAHIYVCVYVCMNIRTHTHTHTGHKYIDVMCSYVSTHTHTYTHKLILSMLFMPLCTHTYTTHACNHTKFHANVYQPEAVFLSLLFIPLRIQQTSRGNFLLKFSSPEFLDRIFACKNYGCCSE